MTTELSLFDELIRAQEQTIAQSMGGDLDEGSGGIERG